MSEVTQILNQLKDSHDSSIVDQLMALVYSELKQLAAARIANEKPGHTLDATGLVHEAYLRLVGSQSFESRRHFFGAASEAMKRILVDRARAKATEKRGGNLARVELEPNQFVEPSTNERLERLAEALNRFAQTDPAKAELVKLRYFVGLKIHEAAEIMGISTATADRHWAYAKAWLQNELK